MSDFTLFYTLWYLDQTNTILLVLLSKWGCQPNNLVNSGKSSYTATKHLYLFPYELLGVLFLVQKEQRGTSPIHLGSSRPRWAKPKESAKCAVIWTTLEWGPCLILFCQEDEPGNLETVQITPLQAACPPCQHLSRPSHAHMANCCNDITTASQWLPWARRRVWTTRGRKFQPRIHNKNRWKCVPKVPTSHLQCIPHSPSFPHPDPSPSLSSWRVLDGSWLFHVDPK